MFNYCCICVFLLLVSSAECQRPAKQNERKLGTRIIGGQTSVPHQWPFMASLQYHDGYHFCGGALIAQKWVISAAHCTEGLNAGSLRVVLGDHTIGMADYSEQIINVTKIHDSPFYNLQRPEHSFYLPYDLTLLELEQPAILNSYVRTIDLPNSCIGFEGQICKIIGWGRTSRIGQVLQEGDVNIIGIDVCRNTWGSYVYYGSLCVFSWSTTPCQGDSGGPVVCLGTDGYVLAGASSWGDIECGNFPSIYTQIAEHIGWIHDIMDYHGSS